MKVGNKVNGFVAKEGEETKKGFQQIDDKVLQTGSDIAGSEFARNGARGCAVMISEGDGANKRFWPAAERAGARVHVFKGAAHAAVVKYVTAQGGTNLMAEKVKEGDIRASIVGEGEDKQVVISVDDSSSASFVFGAKQQYKGQMTEKAMRSVARATLRVPLRSARMARALTTSASKPAHRSITRRRTSMDSTASTTSFLPTTRSSSTRPSRTTP